MARPRKHKPGTTATERVAASTAALIEAGGARKTFRLSPDANKALQNLKAQAKAPATETHIIEQLLLSAAEATGERMLTNEEKCHEVAQLKARLAIAELSASEARLALNVLVDCQDHQNPEVQEAALKQATEVLNTKVGHEHLKQYARDNMDSIFGEPIGYQRLTVTDDWVSVDQEHIDHYQSKGQLIRPVYAFSQPEVSVTT